MNIVGKGIETFIYVTGIKTDREIELQEGVTLLPAVCNPTSDAIIHTSKSETDLGIAAIFLRKTSSQIKVQASDPKSLAIKTWNSSWNCILLSAIYNCEVGFNIQCDTKAELFSENTETHITNYFLRGLVKDNYLITEDDAKWLEKYFKVACKLIDQENFMNAVHSMSSYRWHSMPRAQLAIIWSGIESLFDVETEITFRLSLYIAKILGKNEKKTKEIFNHVKSLYKARSSAVHGGKVKGDTSKLIEESSKLLNDLIVYCIENNGIPDYTEAIF